MAPKAQAIKFGPKAARGQGLASRTTSLLICVTSCPLFSRMQSEELCSTLSQFVVHQLKYISYICNISNVFRHQKWQKSLSTRGHWQSCILSRVLWMLKENDTQHAQWYFQKVFLSSGYHWVTSFLSRVSILTYDIDIANLSVHLSVCNVLVSDENGLTYRHRFFTIQ